MAEAQFDFAILGSSPFAALLALALAQSEGKRVCLVANPPAVLQLARGIDIDAGPITRPAHWTLLAGVKGEVERLAGARAAALFVPTSIAFTARHGTARSALGHMRHMAAGFGALTEPLGGQAFAGSGFLLHGATRLKRRRFYAALPDWLAEAGVTLIPSHPAEIKIMRNKVRINEGEMYLDAERAVIADAAAALRHLPAEELTERFAEAGGISLLTQPGAALPWPVQIDIGAGASAYGHQDGRVECAFVGAPTAAAALDWLRHALSPGVETRLAGRALYKGLISSDGAPVIGRTRQSRLHVALGFGTTGVFLVPAIARFFTGSAATGEQGFFERHCLGPKRGQVADYPFGRPERAA